jgi:hypothetical protein
VKTPRLLSSALVLGLAAALTLGVVSPASAATLVTPVSNLPSMVNTGVGYTDAGKQGNALVAAMAYLYKNAMSPDAYAAYKARQTGSIPTAAQVSAEDYQKGQFTTPTTPAAGLTKVVNGASTVFGGYTIGTALGSVAGRPIFNAVGIDANGAVCGASASGGVVQKLLELGTGQDCAAFNAAKDYVPNTDVTGGVQSDPACDSSGNCTKILGSFTFTTSRTSDWSLQPDRSTPAGPQTIEGVCFVPTTPGFSMPARVFTANHPTGNGLDYSSNNYGRSYWPGPVCGPGGIGQAIGWPKNATPQPAPEVTGFSLGTTGPVTPATKAPANPDRYISCDVTGSKGEYASQAGAMFRETDTDWTKGFPQCPGLPAEVIPVKSDMVLHVVGGGDTLLSSTAIPQPLVDDLTKYKECFGTSLCALELEKNGQSCFAGNQSQCTDWAKDPDQSQYTCKYGTPGNAQAVSIAECKGVYAPTFQPERTTTGQVYGDPLTGQPVPSNQAPKPDNVKGMDPSVSDDRISCLPNGFTLNPIDWVLAPLKCAFSPRASVVNASLTSLETKAAASMPGQYSAAIKAWEFKTPASGCGGIPVDLFFTGPFTIMNACPGDVLAPVAYWSRIFGNVAIVVIGVMGSARYVGAAFGFTGLGGSKGDDE